MAMEREEPIDDDLPLDTPLTQRLAVRFRDNPGEFFAILGTVVFVLGWVGIIYILTVEGDDGLFASGGFQNQVYFMLSTGTAVTTTSALLWGIAVLAWVRRPPPVGIDGIEVCYDTADWTAQTLRELEAELGRRGIPFALERGELVIEKRFERIVDKLTEESA